MWARLLKEMTSKLGPWGMTRVSQVKTGGKGAPGRGKSPCKGREVRENMLERRGQERKPEKAGVLGPDDVGVPARTPREPRSLFPKSGIPGVSEEAVITSRAAQL